MADLIITALVIGVWIGAAIIVNALLPWDKR